MDVGQIKTSGATFNRFRSDPYLWIHGEYIEGAVTLVNGREVARGEVPIRPDDEVVVVGGYVRRAVGKVPLPFFFQAWRTFVDDPPPSVQIGSGDGGARVATMNPHEKPDPTAGMNRHDRSWI